MYHSKSSTQCTLLLLRHDNPRLLVNPRWEKDKKGSCETTNLHLLFGRPFARARKMKLFQSEVCPF